MTALPPIVDRETWQARIEELRDREKAHTHEGDAIAAARRRLPAVEVDATTSLVGAAGETPLLGAFDGRSQLVAYFQMWHLGKPAAGQCEGCTFNVSQLPEPSYLHSRDVSIAVFREGPYDVTSRYREFLGWQMPWYSVPAESVDLMLAGRNFGMYVCYLRDGDRVFETFWATGRAAARPWATATRCSTGRSTAGRSRGRTHRRGGRRGSARATRCSTSSLSTAGRSRSGPA